MTSALAPVETGWTGTLTVGGVTLTPRRRESVASLMARMIAEVYVYNQAVAADPLILTVKISSTGILTVAGNRVFTLAATSNTATRTGFTGTYTGASTYTAASAYAGAYVPTHSLQLDMAALTIERGSVALSGAAGFVGPATSMKSTLTIWTSYADVWPAELTTGAHDVWDDGKLLGRVFIEGFTRTPPGRLRTGNMRIDADVSSVSIEPIPEIPEAWPVAQAWLYSWVNTAVPGYRQSDIDGDTVTVSSGHLRWDSYISAISAAMQTASEPWDCAFTPSGRLIAGALGSGGNVVTWPDRAGWLMGFVLEAGVSHGAGDGFFSALIPPGGIPLLGASWQTIEVDTDAQATLDRHRRRSGYVTGAARLYRCTLTMTRWAFQALLTGWCLRGKVSVVCGSNTTAIGPSEPGGEITGSVLGLDRVAWLSSTHQREVEVDLIIAQEVT